MLSFNSMVFSKDILLICSEAGIMATMIGLSSVLILIIVSWLVSYMIRFMMEKRSKEFGTYLILGMDKREISNVFMKENLLMGTISFGLGILPGMFLQQVLTTIFYRIFERGYTITLTMDVWSFLLSLGLYLVIFVIALRRMKHRMKKLSIREVMNLAKENEKIHQKNVAWKRILCIFSVAYLILFMFFLYSYRISLTSFFPMLILLLVCLYLVYSGLSAYIIHRITKKKSIIYKKDSLFILRQFASKLHTMQFTMGTVTVLFVFALLGCTVAMMLEDYQSKELKNDLPFDIMIFSDDPEDSFEQQEKIVEESLTITKQLVYRIYENGTTEINQLLYAKHPFFKKGGMLSPEKSDDNTNEYFDYDTYISLSDYNALRHMLGYDEIQLSATEYWIQMKHKVYSFVEGLFDEITLQSGEKKLVFGGCSTEAFAQNGMNGADYLIVVPDEIAKQMTPFYSLFAASLEGTVPENLYDRLNALHSYMNEEGDYLTRFTYAFGTNQIITCNDFVLIKETMSTEMKYVLTSVAFPFIYIAIVFLCVALTVLSVQQVSDSAKYKFRYSVLQKLGQKEREIDSLVFKQLGIYFLCPYLVTALVSSGIAWFLSREFVYYTGIETNAILYYGTAFATFSMIYLLYFVVTFVEYRRNIYS